MPGRVRARAGFGDPGEHSACAGRGHRLAEIQTLRFFLAWGGTLRPRIGGIQGLRKGFVPLKARPGRLQGIPNGAT